MKLKNKLFFLINVLLISFCLIGCSSAGKKINPVEFELFYTVNEGKITDNKVIFAIGNNAYSDSVIEDYIQRFTNYRLEVFIDDETSPYQTYELEGKDVFAAENKLIWYSNKLEISSYSYQIPLCFDDLIINNQIRIVLSYTQNRRVVESYTSEIDGETIEEVSYIPRFISVSTFTLTGKMIDNIFNLEKEQYSRENIMI